MGCRNWKNKDHHTGNPYLDRITKKEKVFGEMSATRIRELQSKPATIRDRTTHWTLSPVTAPGIIDQFYQQTLQCKK
jgi:hypothetical protein